MSDTNPGPGTTWQCAPCGGSNPEGTRFCGFCGEPAHDAAVRGPVPAPPVPPPTEGVVDALRGFVSTSVADRIVASGGRFVEEHRLVTALFADLSGFTALASSLDPERLVEVIDPVLGALTDVLADFGAHVEKFAGDAILALFGAPVAHDDDAQRALRAAMELHRRLAEVSPLPPGELAMHIGVNSGHVVARVIGSDSRLDYAVLGDTVVLAQRLESQAPTGETYVGEATVQLVGQEFELEPVGPLELKGRDRPTPAWRLVGERASAGTRTGPSRGRESELGRLVEVARGAGTGVLLVAGEPGAGKSHLVEAARDAVREARWVVGQCLPYGRALPYRPYVDLVHTLLAGRQVGAHLGHLLGRPAPELAEQTPEALRRGVHDAVVELLEDEASQGPLVCVIEDVHWADESSRELTRELIRHARGHGSFVLVLTSRGETEEPDPWADLPGSERLPLSRLDASAAALVAGDVLGGEAPSLLVEVLEDRCEGNPLFVRELTRTLRDDGTLVHRAGAWQLAPSWDAQRLPETLEGLLSARIDGLAPEAAEVLQAAAVIGRRVRMPLLAALVPPDHLEDSVAVLREHGLLVARGEDLEFHHALMQEAAYRRMLRRRRKELHLHVAEVARSVYGEGDDVIALLARHYFLGESWLSAAGALQRAGELAQGIYANAEAVQHYRQAAEACNHESTLSQQVPHLLLTVADLEQLQGRYDAALETFSAVLPLRDDARAWAGIASSLRRLGDLDAAEARLEEALSSPRLGDVRQLWLERSWLLDTRARPREAEEAALTGLALETGRVDRLTGNLLLRLTTLETEDGRPTEAVLHGLAALDALEQSADLPGQAHALRMLGAALEADGRLDEAALALRRGLDLADRVGSIEEQCGCLVNLGALALQRGDYESGRRDTERAIVELRRIDHRIGLAIATGNLGELLLALGRVDEAEERLGEALELGRELDVTVLAADVTDTLAQCAAARGRHAVAAQRAEEAARLFDESEIPPRSERARRFAAEQWDAAGHPDQAARLMGELA